MGAVPDHAPAALCLRRRDAVADAQAAVDQCAVTIEVDPVPRQPRAQWFVGLGLLLVDADARALGTRITFDRS